MPTSNVSYREVNKLSKKKSPSVLMTDLGLNIGEDDE